MLFFPRFNYNDSPDSGGGTSPDVGTTDTSTQPSEQQQSTPAEIDSSDPEGAAPEKTLSQLSEAEIKEAGFNNVEELKAHLQKLKEDNISPEEKAKRQNKDEGAFLEYATRNDLVSIDDYNRFSSIKDIPDSDLVFARFSADHKDDNPDATPDEIRDAFETEYKLNSENAKAKARGEAKITKEARELRLPLEETVKSAREAYQSELSLKAKVPDYDRFINSVVNDVLKENEFTAFTIKEGEEEIVVKGSITPEEKENIAKMFKNPKTFERFVNGKPDELKATLEKKVRGVIRNAKMDEVQKQIWEAGKGFGTKQGSNIGATNPFHNQQKSNEAPVITLDSSNAKIAAAREAHRR